MTDSETNTSFVYSTAQERDELVAAERKFTDDKVRKIIDFKNYMCANDPEKSFVVINQKGIDPLSLDMLAKASMNLLLNFLLNFLFEILNLLLEFSSP